jgi:hypothetical protein
LLAQTQHNTDALEAGLDTALDAIRAAKQRWRPPWGLGEGSISGRQLQH